MNKETPAGAVWRQARRELKEAILKIADVVPIVAVIFIVLAFTVGVAGVWYVYDCGMESILSVWVPRMKCVAILLVTIFWVVVFGGIGVVLSQVQR